VGSAAVLLLQLIDLCDAYRCNKRLFQALKARMQFMYGLYFAEGGSYGY
jgi:transcription initiation factor TFIID subunit TAF12